MPSRVSGHEGIRSRSEYLLQIYHLLDLELAAGGTLLICSGEIVNTSRSPSLLLSLSHRRESRFLEMAQQSWSGR